MKLLGGIQVTVHTLPPARPRVKCLRLYLTFCLSGRSLRSYREPRPPRRRCCTWPLEGAKVLCERRLSRPAPPKEAFCIGGFSIRDARSPQRGWNGDRVAADLPGRGGRYLKELPALSCVSVPPHQSAFLLNTRNPVTLLGRAEPTSKRPFKETFQRHLPCDCAGSLDVAASARTKPQPALRTFLPYSSSCS